MNRVKWIVGLLAVCAPAASGSFAQEVTYFEKDGIRYQRTRQVNQRPITETRYEQREGTVYRDRYTTEMQDSHRTYQVPITEQQWVPGYQRTWNVFAPPVLSYRLMPVTRWETRSEMVRVPITRRDVVPEKYVQQVPVYNTRYAQEETVRDVAIGTVANGTASVARSDSAGSTSLENDPPREGSSDWRGGLELRR
jgi:hypothetical protein